MKHILYLYFIINTQTKTDMKTSKKQIAKLIESGKVENLKKHCVFFNKRQLVDALHMIFTQEKDSYSITFESAPYSRGGKYARHTSTLTSVQSWELVEYGENGFAIVTDSTSKSSAVPSVKIPKFGTAEAIKRQAKLDAKKEKEEKEKATKLEAKFKAQSAKLAKEKRESKAKRLKMLAKKHGFKSVAAMKRKQKEIDAINETNFQKAKENQIILFEEIEGRKFESHKIIDRVKLSRLEFDFNRMPSII